MTGLVGPPSNLSRFPDLHPAFSTQSALVEASRCLFCFDAPCTAACPTHIDVPRFIKKIATANVRGSALTILDSNILGLSCSRVCPVEVLCEGSCVMHRYNEKPIEIGRLQRFAMERFYENGARLPLNAQAQPHRVACIGAGPASLACAAELRRHGWQVTVFERRPLPGGLNTYGVAEYKFRPTDSLMEVDFVRSLGVEFRHADIGIEIALADLERDYDFVFLGLGLGMMDRLGIPGEDLIGVIDALQFIARYKTSASIDVGRTVAVIGGGNTAIDAANAARRLGADQVHLLYRRGEKEMPAFDFEYYRSKTEGVYFHFQVMPVAIHGNSESPARVQAIECVRVELGEPDSSGRRRPQPIPESNLRIPCDMVIPSLGQARLTGLLENHGGIELKNGCVVVDRPTGRTGNPKYYSGGDCVNGGREVVDAVADGKRAALAIVKSMEQG